jgi:hypothetical protein
MTTQELNTILTPYWKQDWDGYCRFDDGWADLVHQCHLEILDVDPNYKILQIKEKLGGLRYYYQSEMGVWVQEIDNIIQKYEELCSSTCENCDNPGSLSLSGRWYKTLCEECKITLNYQKI